MLQALIFDVDGTLSETEETHRAAFNQAFAEFETGWLWDQPLYRRLLDVTGGKERISHYLEDFDAPRPYAFPEGEHFPTKWIPVRRRKCEKIKELERRFRSIGSGNALEAELTDWIGALHARKTVIYNEMIASGAARLRPGVEALIRHARNAGLRLAIATTTSLPNVESLIRATLGPSGLSFFEAIAAGDMVKSKKPAPDVYLLALDKLGLVPATCLALEDSVNGLLSARAAQLPVVITTSIYTSHQSFPGALAGVADLDVLAGDAARTPVAGGAILKSLRQLHAGNSIF